MVDLRVQHTIIARGVSVRYGQICPMATALDVVGDRWTVLILRELLGGAARFHELQDGLPGIAKNLLTSRLRRLESDGVVRRVNSHSAVLYALTELGAGIRPALEELGFWGARLSGIGPVEHDRSIRAIAMSLQSILVRAGEALPADQHLIELEIGGEHVEISLGPLPTVAAHPSIDPDVRIRVPTVAMSDLLLGRPFDKRRFVYVSGNAAARTVLLRSLNGMAAIS
jgi:DNA-binding HxlR family transcriptional regulator